MVEVGAEIVDEEGEDAVEEEARRRMIEGSEGMIRRWSGWEPDLREPVPVARSHCPSPCGFPILHVVLLCPAGRRAAFCPAVLRALEEVDTLLRASMT